MLCTVSAVMCASLSPESLTASIEEIQKKFATVAVDKKTISSSVRKANISENKGTESKGDDKLANNIQSNIQEMTRADKMLDYYRYFSPSPSPSYPMPYVPYYNPYYQQPYMSAFYSPYYAGMVDGPPNSDEYDEEYAESNDVEDNDDGSRANKRRPVSSKNSPIFYIRLPPTPYMFVPGLGYVSQPPTIQPLTPQYPINPLNPFINLPLTYLSNAKPTGVFPWNQQTSTNQMNFGAPQFPSYLPPRPQKPYRPKPPTSQLAPSQDSKITHLGSYLFNGRPENIYHLMSPYHNPYASPYLPNPYSAPPMPPTPYNPYTPLYAPPALPNYY